MKKQALLLPLGGLAIALTIACSPDAPVVGISDAYVPYGAIKPTENGIASPQVGSWDSSRQQPYGAAGARSAAVNQPSVPYVSPAVVTQPPAPVAPPTYELEVRRQSASSMYRQVKVKRDYLPYRARGRTRRSMRPRYITIHSTQNWSKGADALRHSLALKRSKLGRLSWHYTVDQSRAVQHLPTNEQGNHADFDGPGNKYSIGIEMCENRGNSRSATVDRTAKLAAWLMYKHKLPISRVVPHYKWPRWGKRPANKNCPHFLMSNGKPGYKWRGFLNKVRKYHRRISR